jgi:hypothetical protein
MQEITVVDARSDMILAADVMHDHQTLLLRKGVALNDKNIKILKSWGITRIKVNSDPHPEDGATTADPVAHIEAIEKRMRHRFGETDENEIKNEIQRVATQIIIARYHAQEASDAQ